jgi:RIO kinase 1
MKKCKEVKQRKDKSDRNTKDKVLDQKTLSILNKLIVRKKIIDLQGSICTGKEANVYLGYASTELYSKYVKNIHILDNSTIKNIYCTKKLQEIIKYTNIRDIEKVIKESFGDNREVFTLSKRKLKKKNKKGKNVVIESTDANKLIQISKNEITEKDPKILEKDNEPEKDQKKLEKDNEPENVIEVAIKIYKTSAMNFKDRERYLESEKRFKKFCTKNSRKLIKLWAEKEVRNLKRLNKQNIPSPTPIYLKRNILIMSLVGNPADRLKDAFIEDPVDCYNQVLQIIDDMYNKCNLIHADLSEYNLLYHEKIVYVIDVGQSVEKDHINAVEFLITDLININNFFTKIGVEILSLNDLFCKITKTEIPEYLRNFDLTKNAFIPAKLDDVHNMEDVKMFTNKPCGGSVDSFANYESSDENDESSDESNDDKNDDNNDESNDDKNDESNDDNNDDNNDESNDDKNDESNDDKNDDTTLSKKERKKLVKEFNKERRAYKISKIEKKRIFKKYIGKKKK